MRNFKSSLNCKFKQNVFTQLSPKLRNIIVKNESSKHNLSLTLRGSHSTCYWKHEAENRTKTHWDLHMYKEQNMKLRFEPAQLQGCWCCLLKTAIQLNRFGEKGGRSVAMRSNLAGNQKSSSSSGEGSR